MRILVVSDTHRKQENLEWVLGQIAPIDLLIHLGDVEGCEYEIAAMADCPVEMIAGNNDFFSDLDREKELQLGKHKILITHGHYYYVHAGITEIKREAKARGCDIVMFGHTHRPLIDDGDVLVLNPGSISYPRQEGHRPSYIVMEIDADGEAHFELEYM